MSFDGTEIQNEIYRQGKAEWPITPSDWEQRAETVLEPEAFDYVAGGAGSELTMRANAQAFTRRHLRPRMLTGNLERDISVDVLATHSAAPFFLAPIGVLSIAHLEGELAAARAAVATGVPFILSSAASHSIEEVAKEMGDASRWFQLYWVNDRAIMASFVERASASGYGAIVVTLDTLILGWRPRDLKKAYLPFLSGAGCAQFFSDPVFRKRLSKAPEQDPLTAAAMMLATFPNLGLTWSDLEWLRRRVELPLLVKGVLTPDDALRARDCGIDGVIVSNHGGRQVDGAIAALDAFVEVRAALGAGATVLVDGGVRTGADVLKAMALGANAVLLGRPYAYGLAVGGQQGAEAVIRQLMAETDITLALIGGRSVRDLDRSVVD
ncbi:MAG TPA: alpha-hydroxy-acid oxidizing protein [Acidimicrobiales bacterium]|nr:alpha-hydroxy-acid oxidizing protein [Acidimicrobiales bacterium]